MRLFALWIAISATLFGQRVLYNQGLDEKGKSASAAAKKLTSTLVTDNELANLAVLEKAQIERVLGAAAVTMRREVEALTTWKSVVDLIDGIQRNIDLVNFDTGAPEEIKQRLNAIDEETSKLKQALESLKMASNENPPSLDPVINLLGDVQDFTAFAGEVAKIKEAKEASTSLQEVVNGLKELNALITSVNTIWRTAQQVRVDPKTLAPSKEETELAVLAIEAQYLKELTLLRARKQLDLAEVRKVHDQVKSIVQNYPQGKQIRQELIDIAEGLDTNDFDTVRLAMDERVHVLYLAASAAAQNMIAADIESMRETLAWRRYQIRTQAVYNGSYETAIKAASDRLAAYYGAGLKPTQIAQLLHDLAALVSLPKIAF